MAWACLSVFSPCALIVAISSVFLLDLSICLAVFSMAKTSRYGGDMYDGQADDTLLCCALRICLFPFATWLAFKVYKKREALSPLRRLEAEAVSTPGEARGATPTPTVPNPASPSSEVGSVNGIGVEIPVTPATSNSTPPTVPLLSSPSAGQEKSSKEVSANCATSTSTASTKSACTSSSARQTKSPEQLMFEMKRDHTLMMKKASKHSEVVMAMLFALSTALSMYNGLKAVRFHYDPKLRGIENVLLGSLIFIISAEYFMLKDFLEKMLEEKGELIGDLHMHPVFFETDLKCHSCDICHERMKPPNYIAYRCRTCDFDICPRCYKQKDKQNAKGYGARSIRRDGEQVTTWTYFRRIIKLTLECWQVALLAIVCLVMTQAMQVVAPSVQGSIFDGVIKYMENPEGNGRTAFQRAMITYLVVNVLTGAFGGLKALAQELVTRQLACSVRTKLFNSIILMDITFFDGMHTGQLTSRLTNDASQMVQPLNTLLNDLIANAMLLVGGMFMAFHTSWKLSLVALSVVPPITYIYRQYAHWGRKVNRSIYAAYGEANSTATEAIQNIRTVRGFSTETHEMEKYDFSISTALQHGKKNAYVAGSVNAASNYMNLGTAVLILWYGGELVCETRGEAMSVGKLITFQLYWNMMNNAFISLGNVFNDLIRSSSAAERVFSLMDAKPEVDPNDGWNVKRESEEWFVHIPAQVPPEVSSNPQAQITINKKKVEGCLELQHLEFRYRTRPDKLVLKKINLAMQPGTSTALVGKSGGGKSTIVHLLMRFYEPTGGKILLDGNDMKDLSSLNVRQLCGFVAQDTQLFATSIEENLSYGLGRKYTKEELHRACEQANSYDFIMETEEGFETRVGEKGIMLSGGQRQRLAIARCFLRKPKLLFLDEATSALDAENEGHVQRAIDNLIKQEATHSFKLGSMGITHDESGFVQEVSADGPAQTMGIKKGDRIVKVNAEQFSEEALDRAEKNESGYDVTVEQGRCTVVLIAHRLSTVKNCNQIAVIMEGNIKERGTHQELVKKGGFYKKLVDRQMCSDASTNLQKVIDDTNHEEEKAAPPEVPQPSPPTAVKPAAPAGAPSLLEDSMRQGVESVSVEATQNADAKKGQLVEEPPAKEPCPEPSTNSAPPEEKAST